MKKINITEMLIYVVAAELAGAFSGLFSGGSFAFYNELNKPPLSPPGWVFPAVWGVLYAVMGLSAYFIKSSGAPQGKLRTALTAYIVQLAVNFTWSIVFFGMKQLSLSAAVILLLIAAVIIMTVIFYKIRPVSACLNIPYILWLAFASYLNIGVLILNK